jgi:hypothetical protein
MLRVWGSSCLLRNVACLRNQLVAEECCVCEEAAICWGMLHVWGSSHLVRNVAVMPVRTHSAWLCFCVRKTSSSVFIIPHLNGFDILYPFLMNQDVTKWLASHLPPLPCHCTDNCQLDEVLSVCEVDYFHVLWSGIPPQSLNVCYAFKKCVFLINSWVLCFQRLHYTFIAGVSLFCGTNWPFCFHYLFWYLCLQCFRMLSLPVIQETFRPYCVWMEQF